MVTDIQINNVVNQEQDGMSHIVGDSMLIMEDTLLVVLETMISHITDISIAEEKQLYQMV